MYSILEYKFLMNQVTDCIDIVVLGKVTNTTYLYIL